jgi:enoyl-CoA hydratase
MIDPRRAVRRDDRGAVAVLTVDRPAKLNAWTGAMREQLANLLRDCAAQPDVRAVVLTGAGDRAFCAGQDLAETQRFQRGDHAGAERWIDGIERFYDALRDLDKPLVAALNGVAAGSGFQAALLCDVRIAHSAVQLGQPEVNSGIPSITGTYLMAAAFGMSRTVELVLSGRLMSAPEALAAGVVHEIVPAAEVHSRSVAVAAALAEQPSGAVARTKAWVRQLTEDGYRAAFRAARVVHRDAYATGEPQRMMARFLAGPR